MAVKLPNPKYIPKPHQQMDHPGQRVQIDVKFVPAACLVGQAAEDGGYYQYPSWGNTVAFDSIPLRTSGSSWLFGTENTMILYLISVLSCIYAITAEGRDPGSYWTGH